MQHHSMQVHALAGGGAIPNPKVLQKRKTRQRKLCCNVAAENHDGILESCDVSEGVWWTWVLCFPHLPCTCIVLSHLCFDDCCEKTTRLSIAFFAKIQLIPSAIQGLLNSIPDVGAWFGEACLRTASFVSGLVESWNQCGWMLGCWDSAFGGCLK